MGRWFRRWRLPRSQAIRVERGDSEPGRVVTTLRDDHETLTPFRQLQSAAPRTRTHVASQCDGLPAQLVDELKGFPLFAGHGDLAPRCSSEMATPSPAAVLLFRRDPAGGTMCVGRGAKFYCGLHCRGPANSRDCPLHVFAYFSFLPIVILEIGAPLSRSLQARTMPILSLAP